jgi:uncharacterized membrane protein (Fun14 family)
VEFPDLTTLAPYLEQISFGLIAGFASGYAFKKLGKLMAFAVGLLFIALQILAFYGLVTINWGEIQSRVDPLLEAESLRQFWQGLLSVLTFNITFAAAFVPGFLLGMRRG